MYGCRYVHSIIDEKSGEVLHLDGAIRMYDDEGMVERLGVDLKTASRQTEYTKLWRTDHALPVSLWKRVVNDYYRDNYLVGEYLGGDRGELEGAERFAEPDEPSDPLEAHVGLGLVARATKEQNLVELLVPYAMQTGDGVLVRVGMRSRPEPTGVHRRFRPFLLVPDREYPEDLRAERLHALMEIETLHLKKVIERRGGKVGLPAREMWVQYRDDYINLAPVAHETEDPELVSDTMQAIKEYLTVLRSDRSRTVVAFTVAYVVGDREVVISAAGPVADVLSWFDSVGLDLPRSENALAEWAGRTAKYQSEADEIGIDPLLMDTVSGLFIGREVVGEAFQAKTWFDEDAGRPRWSVEIDTSESAPPGVALLQAALTSETLTVATSWVLRKVTCTRCDARYADCECTVLDEGLALNVEDGLIFTHTWTDARD